MKLNKVEEIIYATVWANEYQAEIKNVPGWVIKKDMLDKGTHKEWEISQGVAAAETACYAVLRFREIDNELKESFEGYVAHDMYEMLKEGS